MPKSRRRATIVILTVAWMVNAVQAVQVVAWRSVRTHGGLGAASIPLNPVPTGAGSPTVEPRSGGIQRIEVDFNGSAAPLVASGISVVGVSHNAGGSPLTPVAYALTSATLINSNTTLQINFNAGLLPDETCYRIDLANAIASLTGDTDCYVRALVGDANGSGSVTLADALAVKAKIGQPPLSNAAFDIIPGSTINLSDAIFTKTRIGKLVTCALPSGSCVVTADCTAQDQCHDPGTCNPTTFACSNPIKSNGSGCNDGNACTQADSCQTGVCVGANPVACSAQDQCHLPGVCNPATGACSNPIKADGTGCNDGSACTQLDTCQAGVCVGSNPVVCGGTVGQCDTCLEACNPATGQCGPGIAPNGTACGDVDVCTLPGICQDGVCTGMALPDGSPCDDGDPCTVESCHSGHCVTSNAPDSTVCDDGNPCTVVDLCRSGVCVSGRLKNCDDHNDHNFDFCDAATGACMHQADPLDPPCIDGCLGADRCCRQSTSPGVFTMECTSFFNICEDAGGTIGTACGGFVCPLGDVCCGGADCCTQPEVCFQGKCLDCTFCGANCCMNGSEICDLNTSTCHPACGNLGIFCLPGQQCCPNLNKCCDATSQICGITDCEAANPCPPGEIRLPGGICCIDSIDFVVCGNNCCNARLGETCNQCTGHCDPPPPVAVTYNLGTPDVAERMTHPQPGDGHTTPNTVGGRTGKMNVNPGVDKFFYFAVDDSYAFNGNNPTQYITVNYYDSGTGSLQLTYDSISGGPYKDGPSVSLTNTNTWKSVTWTINGAYFGNRENNGADFRIFVGGVTQTLDFVQVANAANFTPAPLSVDLGTTDVIAGVTPVIVTDGDTTPITIGGRNARQNVNPAEDFYFYFDAAELFSFQGSRPDLYIKVDYYDTGSGIIALEYDGAAAPYVSGPSVALTNTNTWKRATWHVTDAYFGNRQNNGADFRIFLGFGTRYLDVVSVSTTP